MNFHFFSKLNIIPKKYLKRHQQMEFLNFQPGLVGGHCVSVDPYYLTYKSRASMILKLYCLVEK